MGSKAFNNRIAYDQDAGIVDIDDGPEPRFDGDAKGISEGSFVSGLERPLRGTARLSSNYSHVMLEVGKDGLTRVVGTGEWPPPPILDRFDEI